RSRAHRPSQDSLCRAVNSADLVSIETRRKSIRSNSRLKQNLIGIDVSDAGDHALIHQQRFYLPTAAFFDEPLEKPEAELQSERFRSHLPKCRHLIHIVNQHHPADFPRASKREPPCVLKNELDAGVV